MEIFAIISILILPTVLQACVLVSDLAEERKCGPTAKTKSKDLPNLVEGNCKKLNLGTKKCEDATDKFIAAFSAKDPKTVKRT